MEKEFLPYDESLALKELGFDEQCLALYDLDGKITIEFVNWKNAVNRKNNYLISAPLYQQAFRWFREKYNLNSFIIDSKSYNWYFNINDMIKFIYCIYCSFNCEKEIVTFFMFFNFIS